jgi:hypothetical protein
VAGHAVREFLPPEAPSKRYVAKRHLEAVAGAVIAAESEISPYSPILFITGGKNLFSRDIVVHRPHLHPI